MAKRNIFIKWFLALLIIIAVLAVWQYVQMPEELEAVPEQVEEIDWTEVDKIEFIADNDVQISKVGEKYMVLTEDTTYEIDKSRLAMLFATFNNLQLARLKPVDFSEWTKAMPDSSIVFLKLYRNTEEVLDLYIHTQKGATYLRYLEDKNVYKTNTLTTEQFLWLDSLSESMN